MVDDLHSVIVPATELQNLPNYKLYVRTLLNGRPQEPYLVDGFPPFEKIGTETTAAWVIRRSLQRYGRNRQAVEQGRNRVFEKPRSEEESKSRTLNPSVRHVSCTN